MYSQLRAHLIRCILLPSFSGWHSCVPFITSYLSKKCCLQEVLSITHSFALLKRTSSCMNIFRFFPFYTFLAATLERCTKASSVSVHDRILCPLFCWTDNYPIISVWCLCRNVVKRYHESGYLWEQYDNANEGKGKGSHPFTGWTSLILLIMGDSYWASIPVLALCNDRLQLESWKPHVFNPCKPNLHCNRINYFRWLICMYQKLWG